MMLEPARRFWPSWKPVEDETVHSFIEGCREIDVHIVHFVPTFLRLDDERIPVDLTSEQGAREATTLFREYGVENRHPDRWDDANPVTVVVDLVLFQTLHPWWHGRVFEVIQEVFDLFEDHWVNLFVYGTPPEHCCAELVEFLEGLEKI